VLKFKRKFRLLKVKTLSNIKWRGVVICYLVELILRWSICLRRFEESWCLQLQDQAVSGSISIGLPTFWMETLLSFETSWSYHSASRRHSVKPHMTFRLWRGLWETQNLSRRMGYWRCSFHSSYLQTASNLRWGHPQKFDGIPRGPKFKLDAVPNRKLFCLFWVFIFTPLRLTPGVS
jgi:hypothetical protein